MSQRKRGNFKGKTKDVDLFSVAAPTASDTFDKLNIKHMNGFLMLLNPRKIREEELRRRKIPPFQSLPIERHQRKRLILKRDRK